MSSSSSDEEREVLRAAVTEASGASSAALGRVQEALYAFRARLASCSAAPQPPALPALQAHFEGVLDVCDAEMLRLNASTRALAARIRASGSAVVMEEEGRGGPQGQGGTGPAPRQPPSEKSAVGRAASVPLGELQTMLEGLEAGHVRHVLALGSSSSSSLSSSSLSSSGLGSSSLSSSSSGTRSTSVPASGKRLPPSLPPSAAASAAPSDIAALLQQLASIRQQYTSAHGRLSPSSALMGEATAPVAAATAAAAAAAPSSTPSEAQGDALQTVQRLKMERRELEIELLLAHKAIGALQSKLVART
jgi:hypothetical protein